MLKGQLDRRHSVCDWVEGNVISSASDSHFMCICICYDVVINPKLSTYCAPMEYVVL